MPIYDHALSPRLGQPAPVESTSVRMFSGGDIPEAAWVGQMIYRTDLQVLQVYTDAGAWEDVVGGVSGILTFVGPDEPTANGTGDLWYDTTDQTNALRRWNGTTWEVIQLGTASIADNAITEAQLAQVINLLGPIFIGELLKLDPNGGLTVPGINIPPDGSTASITSDLVTEKLTVGGNMKIRGETNTLEGALELNEITVAPTAAPTVTALNWSDTDVVDYASIGGLYNGIIFRGVSEFDADNFMTTNGQGMYTINKDTGVITFRPVSGVPSLGSVGGSPRFWMCPMKVGSYIFVAAQPVNEADSANVFFDVFDLFWNYMGRTDTFTRPNSGYPTFATAGTYIWESYRSTTDNRIKVRRYPITGVLADDQVAWSDLGYTGTSIMSAMAVGNMDYGTPKIVAKNYSSSYYRVNTQSTGTLTPDGTMMFYASPWTDTGLAWDSRDGRLWNFGYAWNATYGRYTMYGTPRAGNTQTKTRKVKHTWYSSTGTPVHETPPSPYAVVNQPARGWFRVQTPPPSYNEADPESPDSARIYITGKVDDVTYECQASWNPQTSLTPPQTEEIYSNILLGVDPPSSNAAPDGFEGTGTPGFIYSEHSDGESLIQLAGDGSWRLGNLSGDSNGEVANTQTAHKTASGTGAISVSAADNGSTTISFPVGLFDSAPKVFAIQVTTGNPTWILAASGHSTSGATIRAFRPSGVATGTINFDWHAIQQDP